MRIIKNKKQENHAGVCCIEFKNISFGYGGQEVLKNINFTIASGDYVGIVGPNGAGKTTLLKIMLGLLEPTQGSINIFGHGPEESQQHVDIGYVPQKIAQTESFFPATVYEVIKSGRTAHVGAFGHFGKEDYQAVESAMQETDVQYLSQKLIGNISGGERQRVYIARALAGEPKVLVLDEPTVGVDISAKEKFYALLEKLNTERGLTIIIVSHDVDVVANEVKYVLCLNQELVCHVSSKEFKEENMVEKLYGSKSKYIHHSHNEQEK